MLIHYMLIRQLSYVEVEEIIPAMCTNHENSVNIGQQISDMWQKMAHFYENVFICSYVVCVYAHYCHVVSMQGVPWSFSALKYR